MHDLADENPGLLKELIALWHFEAGRYFGLPLEDRSAVEVLTTPRPQMSPPRDRYLYFPGTLEVPEAVAVNIRGRPTRSPQMSTSRTRRGRCDLLPRRAVRRPRALHQGRQAQVRLQLSRPAEQADPSDADVPAAESVLGVEFTKELDKDESPMLNNVSERQPHIDDKGVGELKEVKTQLGKFTSAVKASTSDAMGCSRHDRLPGDRPWEFGGGTIEGSPWTSRARPTSTSRRKPWR